MYPSRASVMKPAVPPASSATAQSQAASRAAKPAGSGRAGIHAALCASLYGLSPSRTARNMISASAGAQPGSAHLIILHAFAV